MANEQEPAKGDQPKTGEDLKNVKAEFNRKFDGLNKDLKQSNDALMAQLKDIGQRVAQPEPKPISVDNTADDLYYTNPEAWAKQVKDDAAKQANDIVETKIQAQQAKQLEQQTMINELLSSYPELGSNDHKMTQRALEIFGTMPEKERQSTLGYKLAVQQAASEQGIKPKAMRTKEEVEDSYSLKGDSGMKPPQGKPKGKIDSKGLAFAHFLGIDVDDPEVLEKLEDCARPNWLKYQEVPKQRKYNRSKKS